MSRVLLLVLAVAVSGGLAAREMPREMTVKISVTPIRLAEIAPDVLEFYEVTPEYVTCGVTEETYKSLVERRFDVEVLVPDVEARARSLDAFYHTYAQLRDTWAIIAQNHPDICVLDTIGLSANGNLILAMKITDNPTLMEGEPRICYDYSIHGNENNGCEIAHFALIQLVSLYGTDPDITRWVNTREIWLIPMDNPDGLISRSRYNGHGVDCNRNYGYSWDAGGPSVFSEPEVQSFYHLAQENPMAMWTQYHSGTLSSMWPWGYTTKATLDSVDHAYETQTYGAVAGYPAYQISRGLYSVHGGSTDWYYGAVGALGLAHEVANGQPSPVGEIDTINARNWRAMKGQIQRIIRGANGYVTDSASGRPVYARVTAIPPDWFTYTDSTGFFHKYLHGGTYSLKVEANGYATKTVTGVVVPADSCVGVSIALVADTAEPVCAFRVVANKIKESPSNTNPTMAAWALGKRDDRRFSLGTGGWSTWDMGKRSPIINGAGNDFFVVEGDADPEACSVYVSNDWNGPWTRVGFGTGTQGYDLSVAGLGSARFVRVADDNVGGTGPYAGFDLDAIEAVVVNAPALLLAGRTVIDTPPGGNNDGKLDPGENAALTLTLRNGGRVGVASLTGVLRTGDQYVSVPDSTGAWGDIGPDSVRVNAANAFRVAADAMTPREHSARMVLHLSGTDFSDSIAFDVTVGELRAVDPIPDGPRQPARFWAYDDVDTAYAQHPQFGWVEINGVGTRLTLSDDQTSVVSLPSGFGPWR
ncbi:MAG: M14 family zinc carboxypeptidase, partial [bacterium]